ncbi:MAG: DUF4198 domain-containing protein [Planctomycetes bacterium]|nr:DUF4198 domain-containing protein [Planctomycetota bacterium]
MRTRYVMLAGLGLLVGFSGCSSGSGSTEGPATIPVTVTVKYKGEPVEGAVVTFVPEASDGKGASGTTDADGVAKLTTYKPGDGVLAGAYKVKIVKFESAGGAADASESGEGEEYEAAAAAAAQRRRKEARPRNLLPTKYANPDKSGLTANVSEENTEFTFELTD